MTFAACAMAQRVDVHTRVVVGVPIQAVGPRSLAVIGAPFGVSIVGVLASSPKRQVLRIAAGWIVASMEEMKAIGDRPIRQLPSDAVSARQPAVEPHLSIPERSAAADELTAAIWLVYDTGPQSLGWGLTGSLHG